MEPTQKRVLGKSGVAVTQLGFGGAGLGELFVRVDEATAAATLAAAWDAGIRYFDTAPFYVAASNPGSTMRSASRRRHSRWLPRAWESPLSPISD